MVRGLDDGLCSSFAVDKDIKITLIVESNGAA